MRKQFIMINRLMSLQVNAKMAGGSNLSFADMAAQLGVSALKLGT